MNGALTVLVLVCFGYLALVYASYFALIAVGAVENAVRRAESRTQDYATLATSRFTIPVSVILAAYNEEVAISATVWSLLRQDYPEFEVIVVNDGSKDLTVDRLRQDFELEPVEMFPRRIIEASPVRLYYRSKREPRLIVVDKENGGKADAINAGINVARFRYVCGVDADTVFAQDALLRGMRLVMSDPARIVGVTAHLAIAEDPGAVMRAPVGSRPISRRPLMAFQHLDYLRAFFNNRVAWSRYGFMLCAIGAFQIWRRDLLEELGGFARGYTCEDIELTFRVHERLRREGRPFAILCLPDSVGVTEGPDTVRKLVAQRERWQRVILETLWAYRSMCLNPRYGTAGMLGVPYYVLSEALAPIFEVIALGTLGVGAALGIMEWEVFVLTTVCIALVNGVMTAAAVFADDFQARAYTRTGLAWLLVLAPLDLVLYRPIMAWARIKGTYRFLKRDRGWYKFERNQRA
jgi:cellulose synthase/poly-beta-1,6-N-acetylglucosamine synthase-like glycosyltransferase